tara:strand:+ start:212 stop:523 length:312 start_codon:yes stop_codon:yes gene_type:complete
MIYFFWLLYFFLTLVISVLLRKFFHSRFLKSLSFSLTFSFLTSIWFSQSGSSDLAPIFSIMIFDMIQDSESNLIRLLRPFGLVFLIIFIVDLVFNFRRKQVKN